MTGATSYYHAMYTVFGYFASFTGSEDDIFEDISNLYVQKFKFIRKNLQFWQKIFQKVKLHGVCDVCFFNKSEYSPGLQGYISFIFHYWGLPAIRVLVKWPNGKVEKKGLIFHTFQFVQ